MTATEAQQHLAKKRLQRPVAPHLGIYKWQITSVLSSLERITGSIFSGGLYIFGTTYFLSSYLGWGLSSASMAAAFGALPLAAKTAAKFCIAWPLAFHCINGLRYLTWDTARAITNVQVVRTGWMAVGATTATAVAVAFFM